MTQDPAWRINRYRLAIAAAIDAIDVQLTSKVQSVRPDLERRIETELATFGRLDT